MPGNPDQPSPGRTDAADFAFRLIAAIAGGRRQTVPHRPQREPFYNSHLVPYEPYRAEAALQVIEEITAHRSLFDAGAAAYADARSRDLLAVLYAYRALGPFHVTLPLNEAEVLSHYADVAGRRVSAGQGAAQLDTFRIAYLGHDIALQCRAENCVASFYNRQYHFDREGLRIQPEPDDVVLDAGACYGDTAVSLAAAAGPGGKVISFDPLPSHAAIFRANMALNPALSATISLIEAPLSTAAGEIVYFSEQGPGSRISGTGNLRFLTESIDHVVHEKGLGRLDFIKMDIEGAEASALLGGAEAIRRFRPKLAISGYHNFLDLLTIPLLIKQIEPAYRIHLDHHTLMYDESVIYAVPHSRTEM